MLAYNAYALPTVTRISRAATAKTSITSRFNTKQQSFIDFVFTQYVHVGVEDIALDKLAHLLKLKYHDAIADAVDDLGKPEKISNVFSGFQQYLYPSSIAA